MKKMGIFQVYPNLKIRSKTRTLRALESIQFPDSNFKEDNS